MYTKANQSLLYWSALKPYTPIHSMAKVSIRDGALQQLTDLYPNTTTTEAVMSAVNEVLRLRGLLVPAVAIPVTITKLEQQSCVTQTLEKQSP